MKSHELSLIRAEGLNTEDLQFSIYIDEGCYGILDLDHSYTQQSLFLPMNGNLSLKVSKNSEYIGTTTVDIMILEQDGLQWLPILAVDSDPIFSLPEEVPTPRILISLYSSRSKCPSLPISFPTEVQISEIVVEKIPENIKDDPNEPIESNSESENLKHPRRVDREKTLKMSRENVYEEIIDKLKRDLDKSQKKNFKNKKVKREMKLELRILNEKIKKLKTNRESDIEMLVERVKELEYSLKESSKMQENLQEVIEGFMESSVNLEKILKQTNEEKNQLEELLRKSLKEKGELEVRNMEVFEIKGPCDKCEKQQSEIKGHLENTKRLYQTIQIMTEKLNTQEFHNQELLIMNQELQLENEKMKIMEEGLADSELCCNCLPIDEIDEIFIANYPTLYRKTLKVISGIYIIEHKKVKVIKSEENKIKFYLDGKEVQMFEKVELAVPKHEKNSLSLEDISNHIENYKSQSLIHSRANLRDNKLRVLAKQW